MFVESLKLKLKKEQIKMFIWLTLLMIIKVLDTMHKLLRFAKKNISLYFNVESIRIL